jgi:hypothetical protein
MSTTTAALAAIRGIKLSGMRIDSTLTKPSLNRRRRMKRIKNMVRR